MNPALGANVFPPSRRDIPEVSHGQESDEASPLNELHRDHSFRQALSALGKDVFCALISGGFVINSVTMNALLESAGSCTRFKLCFLFRVLFGTQIPSQGLDSGILCCFDKVKVLILKSWSELR